MAGSIRKARDGALVADISIEGKRRTKRCRTRAEAQAWLAEIHGPADEKRSATLLEARQLSLKERWAGRAYERTAAIYSQSAVDWFGPACLVSEITAPKVSAWRDYLLQQGNRPATVNRKMSALRAMLSDACLHGHLSSVPALPQQLRCNNTKDRVITDRERDGMMAALVQLGEPAAADLLDFLLETAARYGEAERLRCRDVDLAKKRVTFWQTKNGKPRTIPLTTRAVSAIESHLTPFPERRVWPFDYRRFSHLFSQAKAAIGVEDPALTIHTTRHTCATKLSSAGVSLHHLMTFGGWTSLASVQRYLHLQTDALATCVAALEG